MEFGVIVLCEFWPHLHLQARDNSEKLKVIQGYTRAKKYILNELF